MTYKNEIRIQRVKIDKIDERIVKEIAKRVKLAKKIKSIKKKYHAPILDKSREEEVIKKVRALAKENKINPKRMASIFGGIIRLCKGKKS